MTGENVFQEVRSVWCQPGEDSRRFPSIVIVVPRLLDLPKVQDLHPDTVLVGGDPHVVGLQVTVQVASLMDAVEASRQLKTNAQDLLEAQHLVVLPQPADQTIADKSSLC